MLSEPCRISHGVKQGGVLCPTLWSVYVYDLIKILRKCNIGLSYNNEYIGIFTYADDISIICPTLSEMQYILRIGKKYVYLINKKSVIF